MRNAHLSDTQIIEEVKKGNYQALDSFYRDNKLTYLKWAYANFNISNDEGEDIYHDAFEALVKNILMGKLNTLKFSLRAYFLGIAKHLIYDKFRKKKTAIEKAHQFEQIIALDNVEEIDPVHLLQEEKLDAVIDCMKSLSLTCRSLINLFYNDRKSLREIAELLNYKNEDVAKAMKVRCMAELRLCVKSRLGY